MSAQNESLIYRENFTLSTDYYGSGKKRTGAAACLRVIFCGINIIFMIFGLSLTGVGIWLIVDRMFLYPVFEQILIVISASLMIIGGFVTFVVCLIGYIGAVHRYKNCLIFYIVVIIVSLLILFVTAILAIMVMLQAWNEESVRLTMRQNLHDYYGVNLNNWFNRIVTDGWDRTQSMLMCCSVEDQSWDVYRQTQWYEEQPGIPRQVGFSQQDQYKHYVPKSCCVTNVDGSYMDLDTCQTSPYGPPLMQNGLDNKALYYRGCYTAGVHYLREIQVPVIIGLAGGVAVLLTIGPILAVCLYKKLQYYNPNPSRT